MPITKLFGVCAIRIPTVGKTFNQNVLPAFYLNEIMLSVLTINIYLQRLEEAPVNIEEYNAKNKIIGIMNAQKIKRFRRLLLNPRNFRRFWAALTDVRSALPTADRKYSVFRVNSSLSLSSEFCSSARLLDFVRGRRV